MDNGKVFIYCGAAILYFNRFPATFWMINCLIEIFILYE